MSLSLAGMVSADSPRKRTLERLKVEARLRQELLERLDQRQQEFEERHQHLDSLFASSLDTHRQS